MVRDIGLRVKLSIVLVFILLASLVSLSTAQVCNIKVVTDASPDYYDMDSMIHSMTGNWPTAAEKCWAM